MIRIPETIKHLIIVNVLFYIATLALTQYNLNGIFDLFYISNPNFKPWQFVTYMFMHSSVSFTHIAFNMLALFFLGPPLLQLWGTKKFLFFYFSCGIGAGLVYTAVNYLQFQNAIHDLANAEVGYSEAIEMFKNWRHIPEIPSSTKALYIFNTPALGASGAIFGLLAAFGWYFPNTKLYIYFIIPVTVKYLVPVLVIADIISGISGIPLLSPSNTAYFAHVGGALIGVLIAYFWKKNNN